jgi:glycosyltransferase involved in cell wall biosynthesis
MRIQIHQPSNNSAYLRYRCQLPYAYCKDELLKDDIQLTLRSKINHDTDILILHGMLEPNYYPTIKSLANEIKICWMLDDAMYDVPPHNPVHNSISYTHCEVMKLCLSEIATWIITTTPIVRDYYGHPTKTLIAPNLIDLIDYPPNTPPTTIQRYGWISGNSHWEDAQLIQHLPAQYPDKEFLFFGTLPDSLTNYYRSPGQDSVNIAPNLPNVAYLAPTDIHRYQRYIPNLGLHCGLAPLQTSVFNACKSNLKYLEYSALGIPTCASHTPPYDNTIIHGETGYLVSDNEWSQAIHDISPRIGQRAKEFVSDCYSWQSSAKQQWINTFKELVK